MLISRTATCGTPTSPLLDVLGLRAGLEWFIDGLTKRSGIRIELSIRPDEFPRLGMDKETAIFRVVQESSTNVFRHANADRAEVELESCNDRVVVRAKDYGKGLPADVMSPNEGNAIGVGIAGMRERIRQFGGNLTVSRCEPGTMVEATVPSTKEQSIRARHLSFATSSDLSTTNDCGRISRVARSSQAYCFG